MPFAETTVQDSARAIFPHLAVFRFTVSGYNEALEKIDTGRLHADVSGSATALPDPLPAHPPIAAWREAFKTMGLTPSKYQSSVESLLRRARRGPDDWRTGLKHVDFYNGFSIKAAAPVGGYDAGKLGAGSVQVRAVRPETDRFTPIAGEAGGFPMKESIVAYAVADEIACWALNHRDSAHYGLDEATKEAVFFSEGVTEEHAAAAARALEEIRACLAAHGAACSPVEG